MYNTGFELLMKAIVWLFTSPYGVLSIVLAMLLFISVWCIFYLGDIIRAFDRALKIDKEERP